MTIEVMQLILSGLNVLAVPAAAVGIARWLMRVELRLAKLEWKTGIKTEERDPS